MKNLAFLLFTLSFSLACFAGGNPEYVNLPKEYKSEFTQYDTRNRTNGKQVAVLYANKIATSPDSNNQLGDGAIVVMEIYKTKNAEDGTPVVDSDGVFEKGKFAAIAVMEKRSDWPDSYVASERSGNWGFAIYKADGTEKKNDLDCQSCHTPYEKQDYLFSHSALIEFAKNHN